MKRERAVTFLTALLMASALSTGAMGAMISGLNLPVENMAGLHRIFCLCALAGCVLFSFRRGWIAALVLTGFGLVWLWPESAFTLPARALIARLSWLYDSAYGWGVLEFAGVKWQEVALDVPLGVWGCLTALAAAGTVMQGRGLTPTLLLSLLPVCATVVVTNTVPDAPYLYILMLAVILLLLTATVRRHCPRQAAKLTVLTVVPVAALLGALFYFCPQDTYVNRSEEYLDRTVAWWQSAVSFSADSTGLIDQTPVTPNASATANLSRVGPRNTWGYTVMEATADYSGTVYLRGQDFDGYDGVSWTATADRTENFGGMPAYGAWIYDGEITIRTATPSNVRYLPYYPTVEQAMEGGRMENSENLREYSYGVRHPQVRDDIVFDGNTVSLGTVAPEAGAAGAPAGENRGQTSSQRYTSLPSDTRRWAVAYLQAHFSSDLLYNAYDYEIAAAIADHVRNSAVYDTNTPRMSGDYDDFAQWFLEESDTGYCVHFASAATVLLRAAGVPARYVTGYMFTAEAGKTVEVTADQAHAWVEYYNETLGTWLVLEPTPADLREEETASPATEPEETDPPTEGPTENESQTRPGDDHSGREEERPDLTWLWTALRWLLLPAGLWLANLLQYALRRGLRRAGRSPNARALAYWQDVEALCRFTKQEPPAQLEFLAQKAKFSQHTLTGEELRTFHTWLQAEQEKLKQKPWYQRFICQYVLALW